MAWLREPLLHFLILGAILFGFFQWRGDRGDEGRAVRIVVSQGTVESLARKWQRLWQRPPSEDELAGLIEDYIREEVFYREALAMGLDRDDTIVRRRMRQKMEIFFDDLAALEEPSNDQLAAFLTANPDRFRIPDRFTFQHIYLNPDKQEGDVEKAAGDLLAALNRSSNSLQPGNLGDPFMLGNRFVDATGDQINRLFGDGFAAPLMDMEEGSWHGPVYSGFGGHLLLLEERVSGRMPELDEVRDAVKREWIAARRREINEATYRRLRQRYTVVVEPLPDVRLASRAGES